MNAGQPEGPARHAAAIRRDAAARAATGAAGRPDDAGRQSVTGRPDAASGGAAGQPEEANRHDEADREAAAGRLDEARLAVMLLTRLPAGRIAGAAPPLARAAWAFPLVGV